jgi:hypothetical protein
MNIFGTGNFKFTGTGIPDNVERELKYGRLDLLYQIPDKNELKNPISGVVVHSIKGNYSYFKVEYLIYKEADPTAALETLYGYLGKNVTNVKPRGTIIMDDDTGAPVEFTVTLVNPLPLVLNSDKDKVLVEFKSTKYVDLGQSLA